MPTCGPSFDMSGGAGACPAVIDPESRSASTTVAVRTIVVIIVSDAILRDWLRRSLRLKTTLEQRQVLSVRSSYHQRHHGRKPRRKSARLAPIPKRHSRAVVFGLPRVRRLHGERRARRSHHETPARPRTRTPRRPAPDHNGVHDIDTHGRLQNRTTDRIQPMAEPLKIFFSSALVRRLAREIAHVHPGFRQQAFVRDACLGLDKLELLDRGRHIADTLGKHLPPSYPAAINILVRSLGPEHATDELIGVGMAPFFYLPHTLFVAERGLEHFDLSMKAQYELTKRFSAEGSVRPYIARDPDRAMTFLATCATDKNAHVRRLVSEGTRLRFRNNAGRLISEDSGTRRRRVTLPRR